MHTLDELHEAIRQAKVAVCEDGTLPAKGELVEVLIEAERLGLEGVIAKHVESTYRPGVRSRQWIKLKTEAWRSVHGPRRRDRLS